MSQPEDDSVQVSAARVRSVSILITVGCLALALIHLVWPKLALDTVTLGLIVLAVLPWLRGVIRSVEIPPTTGQLPGSHAWAAAFWEMRGLLGQTSTDTLLLHTWSALQLSDMQDEVHSTRFAIRLLENSRSQVDESVASQIHVIFERRGLKF